MRSCFFIFVITFLLCEGDLGWLFSLPLWFRYLFLLLQVIFCYFSKVYWFSLFKKVIETFITSLLNFLFQQYPFILSFLFSKAFILAPLSPLYLVLIHELALVFNFILNKVQHFELALPTVISNQNLHKLDKLILTFQLTFIS